MSEPLLQVDGLTKVYGAGAAVVEVLKGVTFSVLPGETIAMVGASGAGKSTLMHILGTLDRPTNGTFSYRGEDVFSRNDHQLAVFRNRTIGFVFQFHHLLREFSAVENVMMPALINGKKKGVAEVAAKNLLREVGLEHRFTHKPGELSGGEQQRVAIARALMLEPELLLADEPTGNLDMKTSEGVHDLFAALHQSRGLTVMIVTHNEKLAARMDRIIRMVDGKIV